MKILHNREESYFISENEDTGSPGYPVHDWKLGLETTSSNSYF